MFQRLVHFEDIFLKEIGPLYISGHSKLATYEQQLYEPLELHLTCIRFHIPRRENSLCVFGCGVPTALPWLKPEHQKCVFVSNRVIGHLFAQMTRMLPNLAHVEVTHMNPKTRLG